MRTGFKPFKLKKTFLQQINKCRCAGTYSGGNKRKLSTAIALVGNPSIVFLVSFQYEVTTNSVYGISDESIKKTYKRRRFTIRIYKPIGEGLPCFFPPPYLIVRKVWQSFPNESYVQPNRLLILIIKKDKKLDMSISTHKCPFATIFHNVILLFKNLPTLDYSVAFS